MSSIKMLMHVLKSFLLSFLKDIKNLVRTSVANKIGLLYIKNAGVKIIEESFKYHPWFPIIQKK